MFIPIFITEAARRRHDLHIGFLTRPEIEIRHLIKVDTVGLDNCPIVAPRNIAVECLAKLRDARTRAVERDTWPPLSARARNRGRTRRVLLRAGRGGSATEAVGEHWAATISRHEKEERRAATQQSV